jgi:hypothetical protein
MVRMTLLAMELISKPMAIYKKQCMNHRTLHHSIHLAGGASINRFGREQGGFALTLAMGLGVVMITMGVATLILAQSDRSTAKRRDIAGASLFAAEGGIARTLAQLTKSNNSVLLTQNYDPVSPTTGKNYLGADGIPSSGDEGTTGVNEWATLAPDPTACTSGATTSPNMCYRGTISTKSEYTLLAYRYNSDQKKGTLIVKGQQGSSTVTISVAISISTPKIDFPGVVSTGNIELIGRKILGANGNVYYDPAVSANSSLRGSAAVGDAARPDYLNVLKSGPSDGFTTDNISGKIISHKLNSTLSYPPQGENQGTLNYTGTVSSSSGGTIYYQVDKIELKGNDVITFDTTNGPIILFVNGDATVTDNAQILNTRSDGVPPRVGDLRIILKKHLKVQDAACVQTAFIYAPQDKLELAGKADGCPSPGDSNIDGVVWVNEIATTSGNLSAISVPEDVSSLSDILSSVNLPAPTTGNRIDSIERWQRVQK